MTRPLILAASLFAMAQAALSAEVTGTATYRQRIAMPPGTVFEAVLEDVSRADAPARALSRQRVEDAGNPPYAIALPYDPAEIDPRFTYAVRASLRWPDGRLAFTTDTHAPVLTRGAGDRVEIVLAQAQARETAPLVGPRWRLVAMGEHPVEVEGQREAPHLVFDSEGKVFGSGGCNRLSGGYETGEGGALSFGPAAGTMMACPGDAMTVEAAFHGVLQYVDAYAIEGDRLTLLAKGAPIAEFEAEAE